MPKWIRKKPIIINDDNNRMQIITINVPKIYLKQIEILIDEREGLYPSRSELVRVALRDFLKKELVFKEQMEDNVENYLERNGIHLIGEA